MNEDGFTLLELMIVMVLTTLMLYVLSNFVTDGIASGNQDYNQTTVLVNTKTAVDTVARVVRGATTVEAANLLPDNNAPGAPENLYSWSGAAGDGSSLLLAVPSRDSNDNLIYTDPQHDSVYTDDIIYYLDNSTHRLYQRTLANPLAPGNRAVTTCPPSKATPSCPADALVVEDVADLTTSYLDSSGNTVTVPSGTEAVKFTITESETIGTAVYKGTYTTVVALRNKP